MHYPSQTAAWADYDNDGDLDLYVGNEAEDNFPFPGQLFRNRGDGTFVDVAAGGRGRPTAAWPRASRGATSTATGCQDLYVSNYNTPNRLYRNRGDGTFVDIAAARRRRPARAAAWRWRRGDFDNDGNLDLYVGATTPLHSARAAAPATTALAPLAAFVASTLGLPTDAETGRLYRGLGGGRFEDVTGGAGARSACCSAAASASATSTATAFSISTSAPPTRATRA